jgi:hypothetical protein
MRLPTLAEKLMHQLIVLPAALVAFVGVLVLLYSAISWLLPVGRIFSALPDAVLGLLMMVGGLFVAIVFGKFSQATSGMPNPRFDRFRMENEKRGGGPR